MARPAALVPPKAASASTACGEPGGRSHRYCACLKPASKVLHLARPQGLPPAPGKLLRGTEPSDSDGSHTESGTFCASRRPSLISNRRRAPRHPHYPSRAQGLIALAVKRLPRTKRTVVAGEALGRLASVSIYIYIYIYIHIHIQAGPPPRRTRRSCGTPPST